MEGVAEIITRLRLDANALGVWLLGPPRDPLPAGQREPCEVLASSVINSSVTAPPSAFAKAEAYVDLGETQLYALPVEGATLVVVFDERSSLGLVRLRAHLARESLQPLLAPRAQPPT